MLHSVQQQLRKYICEQCCEPFSYWRLHAIRVRVEAKVGNAMYNGLGHFIGSGVYVCHIAYAPYFNDVARMRVPLKFQRFAVMGEAIEAVKDVHTTKEHAHVA